jgi:hypothetical protein
MRSLALCILVLATLPATIATAQTVTLSGLVRDETGGVLPGVLVELRTGQLDPATTVTDGQGFYRFDAVAPGAHQIAFMLVNFATARRTVAAPATGAARLDAILQLALSADVTVTGTRTFANLADVDEPAANLVGAAQSASQGAITARQLEGRPMMRSGEVLETVPGLIISQHSGEGKANQYYLRGRARWSSPAWRIGARGTRPIRFRRGS